MKIWEGVYSSFKEAPTSGKGFAGEKWIADSLKKIARFKEQAVIKKPFPQ
jgi:hypothetical protein